MVSEKVVMAAGGTGGHLFPAQHLSQQLQSHNPNMEVLFAGAHLEGSSFFQGTRYRYLDVASGTPFGKGRIKTLFRLSYGIWQSFKWLRQEKPRLIVGFGSFHSFPVLCAALACRTPFVLFESNLYPGRVNRWFSRFARFTAVWFQESGAYLKSPLRQIRLPEVNTEPQPEDYAYFNLNAENPIILVFGGSQGALSINEHWLKCLSRMKEIYGTFQVIHLVGREERVEEAKKRYDDLDIPSAVKAFEPHMEKAYRIAWMAVCRSGASTIAELISFALPALLIPFPAASEDHQTKNAQFLQDKLQGALYLSEKGLQQETFVQAACQINHNRQHMHEQLKKYPRTGKALWEWVRDATSSA